MPYPKEDTVRFVSVMRIMKDKGIEELLEAAVNMAKEMAAKPPLALEYVKWAVNEGMQMDLDRALLFESALFAHLYSTEDQKEAMSAFLEKRPTRPFQGK